MSPCNPIRPSCRLRCSCSNAARCAGAAAGADRDELVIRGELYRALRIQAGALIGVQIAIATIIVALLGR